MCLQPMQSRNFVFDGNFDSDGTPNPDEVETDAEQPQDFVHFGFMWGQSSHKIDK